MKFEEVLPALRNGAAIQRTGQHTSWAYLKRSPNGAFHWYGYGDPGPNERAIPMNLDHTHLLAEDWVVVDEAEVKARRPQATFNCPRRRESGRMPADGSAQDHWEMRDGHHACSFCGSLHPDAFMQAASNGTELGPTDKNYKVYLTGAGFDHAKFYFQHLRREQMVEFVALLNSGRLKIGFPGHFYTTPFFISYGEPTTVPPTN